MNHSTHPSRSDLSAVSLRRTTADDLETLFVIQTDPESNDMAGTKPRARDVYFAAWERSLAEPGVNSRVILLDGEIAGSIACFQADGHDCVGYWLARDHWGKGIISRALSMFLREETRRPLHATISKTNAASRHILEKNGFRCTGFRMGEETDRYLARELAEFVLR